MSSLQPSSIDTKKKNKKKKSDSSDPLNTDAVINTAEEVYIFGTLMVTQMFYLCMTIFIGSIVLYTSKISQADLLPRDMNCEPFNHAEEHYNRGNVDPENEASDIINFAKKTIINFDVAYRTNKDGNKEEKSIKVHFPYAANLKQIESGIIGIGFLKEWMNGEMSSPTSLYMATIQQKMISNFASNIHMVTSFFHQCLPESVIYFVTPMLYVMLIFFFGIINIIYGTFLYLYELGLLFSERITCVNVAMLDDKDIPVCLPDGIQPVKEKDAKIPCGSEENQEKEMRVVWEKRVGSRRKHWVWTIMVYGIAYVSFMYVLLFAMPFLSLITIFRVILLPLMFEGNVYTAEGKPMYIADKEGKGQLQHYSFLSCFINALKYNRNIIMFLISFFILIDANSSLGGSGAVFAVIAFLIVYWFYPEVYKKPKLDDIRFTDGYASYESALRTCVAEKKYMEDTKGMDALTVQQQAAEKCRKSVPEKGGGTISTISRLLFGEKEDEKEEGGEKPTGDPTGDPAGAAKVGGSKGSRKRIKK